MWLLSSVGRASHRYRGGHRRVGIPLKPWVFQASSFQLLKLENLLRWSFSLWMLLLLVFWFFSEGSYIAILQRNQSLSSRQHGLFCLKERLTCIQWIMIYLALVVWKMNNAIHWVVDYPFDSTIGPAFDWTTGTWWIALSSIQTTGPWRSQIACFGGIHFIDS